jgi:hypothetical protein
MLFTRLTLVVASRSHCQTICERVKTIRSPSGTIQKTGCSLVGYSGGGLVAKPLPNIGLMVGKWAPLRKQRSRGKG